MAAGQAIRAGAAYIELTTRDSKLVKGLQSASQKLKAFSASVGAMGRKFTATGWDIAKQFAAMGANLSDMSQRTGVSAQALSELGFAAEMSGSNLEQLGGALFRMRRRIANAATGSGPAVRAIRDLGIAARKLTQLPVEQQFDQIVRSLAGVKNESLRAQYAFEIFGDQAKALMPLLNQGADGIEALRKQARDLGIAISDEDAAAAAALASAWDVLRKPLLAVRIQLGAALAPLLTEIIGRATKFITVIANWVKQNKSLVATIFKIATAVIGAGVALIALGGIISGLGAGIGAIISVVGSIGAAIAILGKIIALLLSPIGLVIAAVVALGAYLLYASDLGAKALAWLGERFETLKNDALAAWQGIGDALAAGDLALAAKIVWLTLKMEWRRGVQFLNGLWIEAKEFFLSLWTDAVFGVAKILNNGWATIEVGWTETVGFLADAWSVFTNILTKTWHNTIGFIKKAWVRLKSLFSDEVDVDAEVNRINREVREATEAADQKMLDAIGKRDRERRKRREQIERERAGAEAELEAMQAEEHARRQKQFADDLAETEGELAAARKEWQDAIAEAAKKRAAAEASDPERLKQVKDSLSVSGGVLDEEQRKIETKGTFNALAARGLGADSLAERTARAVEQIAANTKDLLAQAKQGRLVFSP